MSRDLPAILAATASGTTPGSWTRTIRTASPSRLKRRADDHRAARPLGARRLGGLRLPARDHRSGVIASPTEVLERWTLELDALVARGRAVRPDQSPVPLGPGVARGRARAAHRARPGDRRPVDRDLCRDRRRGSPGSTCPRSSTTGRAADSANPRAEPADEPPDPRSEPVDRGTATPPPDVVREIGAVQVGAP